MNEILIYSLLVLNAVVWLPLIGMCFSDSPKLLKVSKLFLLLFSFAAVLYLTLFSREKQETVNAVLDLFWSYRAAIALEGPKGTQIGKLNIWITDAYLLKQIILNILLFVPLGYLMPCVWPRLAERSRGRKRSFRFLPVVLIGMVISYFIECAQLYFQLGLLDLDDIFNNTLGCFAGCLMYGMFMRKS